MAKLKDLLTESGMGGVVSRNAFPNLDMGFRTKKTSTNLADIVEDVYGQSTQKVNVKEFMGEVSNFNQFSKEIYREGNLRDLAEKLSKLAMTAKQHTLQETEDWFDKITVNRNMKDLTGLSNQFKKVATEAQGLQERMGGLYEDMGHILGRYYEIHEPKHEDDVASEGKSYRDGEELEADTVQEGTYEEFFQSALKKWGVSAPDDLEDDEKVKFFNYVDANWSAENETD
tara:strand:+ start:448 stop:1134 length:687 start_codon:yes stop_codon:yes gene_type:complete